MFLFRVFISRIPMPILYTSITNGYGGRTGVKYQSKFGDLFIHFPFQWTQLREYRAAVFKKR